MESRPFSRGTYNDGVFWFTDRGQLVQASTLFFVLSFAAKPSGDIFVGTHFGSGFFRSTDDSNTWCREKQWVDSDGRSGNRINPSNTVFAGTYGLAFFDQVIAPRFGRRSIRVC
jgi:hypothetical protein